MEVMKTVLECIGCWIVAYYASGIVHEGGHVVAGPAASILFGMLCGISLFWGVTVFRAMMTFIPIGMGIFCLNPKAKTGILYSDGGRFLRIVKGGKTAAEEKAIFEAAFLEKWIRMAAMTSRAFWL